MIDWMTEREEIERYLDRYRRLLKTQRESRDWIEKEIGLSMESINIAKRQLYEITKENKT